MISINYRHIFLIICKMPAKKKNIIRKIKNFTINFGPQHPAAHGVLRRAGRKHCKVFHPKTHRLALFF
jgi:hypothetical protein